MSVKKLCLLIHSLSPGGKERVMSELAIFFAHKDNVELHLVIYGNKREIFYPLPDNIRIKLPNFKFNTRNRIGSTIRTILFLRKTIKNINPDSILSFGEYWNNLILLSLIGLNRNIFISDRSQPGKYLGLLHNFLRNLFYKRATGYIVQTRYAADIAIKKDLNKNIKVIGNPIRTISFEPIKERENIVLTVGRLIKTKNIDRLIRIFAKINEPRWKLVIIGDDPPGQQIMQELVDLTIRLNMQDKILFEGFKKDIDSYYISSKIFAFTSSSEGFPNVIGEALSSGMPVVSYDCISGPSEMIEDGKNGFLIPMYDDERFGNSLKLLMKNENLRIKMGQNGLTSISRFSIQNIGDCYYNFITKTN